MTFQAISDFYWKLLYLFIHFPLCTTHIHTILCAPPTITMMAVWHNQSPTTLKASSLVCGMVFHHAYTDALHFYFWRTSEVPQSSLTITHMVTHGEHSGRQRPGKSSDQRCKAEHRGCHRTLSPPWFANQMSPRPVLCQGGREGGINLLRATENGEKRFSFRPQPHGILCTEPICPLWDQTWDVSMW